ncbi:MAG: RNA polymerase sigma-54 factor [Ignavibacteriales bacterium CG_4_9_14_3_um_filter_30_11]|nr:MAG: RNA polymerase sigma-54 factor [Ignavibacteriales bacterium CG_4_9_14_3_um_filter_30_11]
MLSLNQRLSQQQRLSPQQIQYQKLLQLNTLALEQRIKTELELNPILEEEIDIIQEEQKNDGDTEESEFDENKDDEFEIEDFMNDDSIGDTRTNKSNDEEDYHPLTPAKKTLNEYLVDQLRLLNLNEDLFLLGEEIIGNLSDDGYLNRSFEDIVNELRMFEHINVTDKEALELLKTIQTFEPIGIAARDLQECLLIQLRHLPLDQYYSFLAEEMLRDYFEDFKNKRYDVIKAKMNLTDETLKTTVELIQSLNPKPGEGDIDSEQMNQITPDFLIEKVEDNFIITLNDRSVPSVTINKTYLEMIDGNKKKKKSKQAKETYKFLKEKFESAKWFIACIQQRRETLMKIMQSILENQYQFFEKGSKFLKPMIYKDIADEIQMDISTISRVVNNKYVQSPMGIHELKYFFSEGLSTDYGDDISNKHIKELLKDLIEEESKKTPLSDEKISEILNEKGIHVARRTIAKYREQLKIPVARLRKEL